MAVDPKSGKQAPGDRPVDPDSDSLVGRAPARPLNVQPSALALVFVGGILGTLARYGLETAITHRSGGWPVATFGINIAGAFVLGLLLENLLRRGADIGDRRRLRLLAGTGFCGAFTTYSTFALETVLLTRDGHLPTAVAYGLATVVLGTLAAWAGIRLGVRMSGDGSPSR